MRSPVCLGRGWWLPGLLVVVGVCLWPLAALAQDESTTDSSSGDVCTGECESLSLSRCQSLYTEKKANADNTEKYYLDTILTPSETTSNPDRAVAIDATSSTFLEEKKLFLTPYYQFTGPRDVFTAPSDPDTDTTKNKPLQALRRYCTPLETSDHWLDHTQNGRPSAATAADSSLPAPDDKTGKYVCNFRQAFGQGDSAAMTYTQQIKGQEKEFTLYQPDAGIYAFPPGQAQPWEALQEFFAFGCQTFIDNVGISEAEGQLHCQQQVYAPELIRTQQLLSGSGTFLEETNGVLQCPEGDQKCAFTKVAATHAQKYFPEASHGLPATIFQQLEKNIHLGQQLYTAKSDPGQFYACVETNYHTPLRKKLEELRDQNAKQKTEATTRQINNIEYHQGQLRVMQANSIFAIQTIHDLYDQYYRWLQQQQSRIKQYLINDSVSQFDIRRISIGDSAHHVLIDKIGKGTATLEDRDVNLFTRIIRLATGVAGTFGVIMLVIGAYYMIMSQGDENTLQQGKNVVQYALMGLALVFLSYIIVQFVISALFTSGQL